jgi:hypothetical protein
VPEDKFIKKSVSFPPELIRLVQDRADRSFGGNFSACLQRAAEQLLEAGETSAHPNSPTVLVDLGRTLGGDLLAEQLERALMGYDQPSELARLLYARASKHWHLSPKLIESLPESLREPQLDPFYLIRKSHLGQKYLDPLLARAAAGEKIETSELHAAVDGLKLDLLALFRQQQEEEEEASHGQPHLAVAEDAAPTENSVRREILTTQQAKRQTPPSAPGAQHRQRRAR